MWDKKIKILKELKKIEQNFTWSEEDERMFNSALWHVKNYCGNGGKNSGEFEVYNWLKSLKERCTWKPSEGQLECLGYAIEKAEKDWSPLTNNRIYLTLKALKEQLEKL